MTTPLHLRLAMDDANYYARVTDIELSERVTDAIDAEDIYPHSTITYRAIDARWRANQLKGRKLL